MAVALSNPYITRIYANEGDDSIYSLWKAGILAYQLWPQQKDIYWSVRSLPPSVTDVVILCARQFGKSHLGVLFAIEDCIRYPNTCIPIMGPTEEQTVDIVAPRLKEIARDCPIPGLVRRSKSEGKWYIGDSEIVLGGFNTNSSAQRGKTVQNIYIEEVVDSDPDQFVESMRSDLGPALTHSKGGRLVFLTTLPKVPDHPFITEWIPRAKLKGAFFSYTIDDNIKISREQYIRCAELAGCKLDSENNIISESIDWRREYKNEIVRDERVVIIPDFSEKLHVKPVPCPPRAFYQTYIDWGGVRDKTVGLLGFYDFLGHKFCIIDECEFPPNVSTPIIVKALKEMEEGYEIHSRIADVPGQVQVDLDNMGYPVSMPVKTDWQAMVNNLQTAFRLDQIMIEKRCKFLITSLNSAQFNKNKTDFARSEILGHADAIAALMYGWLMKCVESPYPKKVYSQNQFKPVEKDNDVEMRDAINPAARSGFFIGSRRQGVFK